MRRYAARHSQVQFIQVDTAVRWRPVHDLALWKRLLGGGIQLAKNLFVFVKALLKRPDVVHLKTSAELATVRDVLFCATARLFRVPLAYHLHFGRVPAISAARTPEWRMLVLAMRMAKVVMAVDRPTADVLQSLPGVRAEYTPNAIDLSDLPTVEEGETTGPSVLFLGWVIPTKGVEELVQTWSELAPEGWELLVVGPFDSAYQKDLIHRYRPICLRFLGEMSHKDAMLLMARCGIFILPSYTEGFPNVILEAMAYSKPIIATSVGAIPDMLSGECGLLIKPKDPKELKIALLKLIQNEQLRTHCGKLAHQRVQQMYSLDAAFARYANIWLSIAQKK